MNVVHFHRKPFPGAFSIESLFALLREEMRTKNVKVQALELPWFSKGLIRRSLSTRWAAQHQGDINHVTGDVQFICMGLDPRRTILTVHDCLLLDRLSGWRLRAARRYWFEIPCQRVAAITVVSESTRQDLLHYVPALNPAKITVINNPVSPRYTFQPSKFNIDCPRILHIGTKENKNLNRLAKALQGIPCRLIVVGQLTDDQKNALQTACIQFENLVGISDDELANLYHQCDLLSFISTKEGFGIPILEAQAVGRPVVTSNCSSMPGVAGQGACLVDPTDIESIRSGIAWTINNKKYRTELIAAGLENVKRFRVSEIAAQYVRLYEEVWEKSRR